jgi:hypothetical protein
MQSLPSRQILESIFFKTFIEEQISFIYLIYLAKLTEDEAETKKKVTFWVAKDPRKYF